MIVGVAACAGPKIKESQPQGAQPGEVTYYPTGFNPAKDPYWEDPRWEMILLDTLQNAVHDPADTSDLSAPGLHATIKFTFQNGDIEYPEIVSSTGNQDLDKLMLHQIASMQVTLPAYDLQTDQPHEFEMDLDMPTPLETFESTIYSAIDRWKVYPKDPILLGVTGNTTVAFDFQDGKTSNVVMTASSKSKELDRSSITAVNKATMPAVPSTYAGKSMHIEVVFCYTLEFAKNGTFLGTKNQCPTARNVIEITGIRIERTEVNRYP